MPTLRLPTHCPHTCAPCKQGAGPQISKLLSETQPSWGLASHCRVPSLSARVLGPGPSRGTRLGLISCPAPSPNGLQLHKHSQNSEPALSGAPRPQPQHSWSPPPPQAWDSCSGTLATGWGPNPNSTFPEVGDIGLAGAESGVGWEGEGKR